LCLGKLNTYSLKGKCESVHVLVPYIDKTDEGFGLEKNVYVW